jgi:hypothetical protein
MPTTDTDRPRLVIRLQAEVDPDAAEQRRFGLPVYFHLRATVGYLVTEDHEPRLRNILASDREPAFAGLADLTIAAQASVQADGRRYDGERLYGWDVEYRDAGYVDLERARVMVGRLGRIHRRLEAMRDRLGYPESFAAYLLRVATILGIREFVVWTPPRRGAGLYADGELRIMRGGTAAAAWIEQQTREFFDAHPAPAKEPA